MEWRTGIVSIVLVFLRADGQSSTDRRQSIFAYRVCSSCFVTKSRRSPVYGLSPMLSRLALLSLSQLTLQLVFRELWSYQLLLTPIPKAETAAAAATPSPLKKKVVSSQFVYNENLEENNKDSSGSDVDDEDKGNESDSGKSDRSDRTDKTDRTDADLIAQLSEDSDDDSGDNGDTGDDGRPVPRRRQKLKVSDTLVCLLTGLWLLRIPFTHVDIESYVTNRQASV